MSTTQILRYQDKVVSGYLVNDEGQIFSTQGYKRIPVSYFLKNGTYIACKKAVKVMKDGKFFGVFDSVKMCSKIIDIPRRRVSELIKYGSEKNGFEVQPISIF